MFGKTIFFIFLFLSLGGGGITACKDASENGDSTATTPQGGAGGSAGSSQGGAGGSGGEAGGSAGSSQGGAGGEKCVGPCCPIPDGEAAIVFAAPAAYEPGMVGFSGWVQCPYESASCKSTTFSSPIVGSVAPINQDVAVALFGKKPAHTVIRGLGSLHESDSSPAFAYFAHYEDGEPVREGAYATCLGHLTVGGYTEEDGFAGSLEESDEEAYPANVRYTVPEAD